MARNNDENSNNDGNDVFIDELSIENVIATAEQRTDVEGIVIGNLGDVFIQQLSITNIYGSANTNAIFTEAKEFQARFKALWPRNNETFVGRKQLLEDLIAKHSQEKEFIPNNSQTTRLYGLGGIGKTHASVELLYQLLDDETIELPLILPGNTRKNLSNSISELATQLGITIKENTDPILLAQLVYKKLSSIGKTFIVFDNVDNPKNLDGFYPTADFNISGLITSKDTSSWGPNYDEFGLEIFEDDDTVAYAEKMLVRANKKDRFDKESAKTLGIELGQFPLALAQAMAYIITKNCTINYYIEQFKKHKKAMLNKSPFADDKHQESVWLTITFCLKEIKQKKAILYLIQCAFLAAESPIFIRMFQHLIDDDDMIIDECFEAISHFGVITYTNQPRCVRIHDIVQQVLRILLGKSQKQALKITVGMLGKEHLNDEHKNLDFTVSQANLPHARQALEHLEKTCPELLEKYNTSILLLQTSIIFGSVLLGDEQSATKISDDILKNSSEMINEDPAIATLAFMQLFGVYAQLRQYQTALEVIDTALTLTTDSPELTDMLITYQAYCFIRMGRAFQALTCLEKISREQLELWSNPTCQNDAIMALLYGTVALGAGQYTQAEKILGRTLSFLGANTNMSQWALACTRTVNLLLYQHSMSGEEAVEKALTELRLIEDQKGKDHPDLLTPLRVLADLYIKLGKKNIAIKYCKRAIQIVADNFGEDHWESAIYYATIGEAHLTVNKDAEKTIEFCNVSFKILGDPHDHELMYFITLEVFIKAHAQIGKFEKAKALINDVFNDFKNELKNHQTYYAKMRGHLGNILRQEGKLQKAKQCLLEALTIYEKEFGQDSEYNIPLLSDLCWVGLSEQDPEFGKRYADRAIKILEQFSPVERPQLAEFYALSASFDQYLGRLDDSLIRLQRSVRTLERFYPADDRWVATLKQSIAMVYVAQGKPRDALLIVPNCVSIFENDPELNCFNLGQGHRIWAEALLNSSNLAGATEHAEKAEKYFKKLPERYIRGEVQVKKTLAGIYLNAFKEPQKIKRSKILSLEILSLQLEHFGIKDPDTPKVLNTVANACFNNCFSNNIKEDVFYSREAAELSLLFAKKANATKYLLGTCKVIYASAVGKTGELNRTIRIAKSAIVDLTDAGQADSISVGQLYSLIASSQFEIGENETSLVNRRKAIKILGRHLPSNHQSLMVEKQFLQMHLQRIQNNRGRRQETHRSTKNPTATTGFLRTVATSENPINAKQCLRIANYCLKNHQPAAALLFIHYAMINNADEDYSCFLLSKCHMAMKDWVDLQYRHAQIQDWASATHAADIEDYKKSFQHVMARQRLNRLIKNALVKRVAEPPFHTCDIQFLVRTCIMLGDYEEATEQLIKLNDNLDDETFYLRALLAFCTGEYTTTENELFLCEGYEEATLLSEMLEKVKTSQQYITPLLSKLRFKINEDAILDAFLNLTDDETSEEYNQDAYSLD